MFKPNGDDYYKAILKELHYKRDRHRKKYQFENLYRFKSSGDILTISQIQTSLVVSDYRMQ